MAPYIRQHKGMYFVDMQDVKNKSQQSASPALTWICHFFDGLSDGEDQGSVHEGHDDIRVELFVISEDIKIWD